MSKKYVKFVDHCSQCMYCEVWTSSGQYLYLCKKMDRKVGATIIGGSVTSIKIPDWCPLEDSL